ncbi:MAG: acetolactate synthase small subunit [Lachnospiraceae bacterium]|nr:acetolactate synthase small subunit [Lachnospiraceae bacterium]
MNRKVFQLIADNTSGVLSRIAGLFSRRGYNIESITAGVTTDPNYSRITIVTTGDNDILEQIEKQVAKLVDVESIVELNPGDSVFRELIMIKVKADAAQRVEISTVVDIFRASIVDVTVDSLIIELIGDQPKIEAFLAMLESYDILETARTGIAGLSRGTESIVKL